MPESVKLCCGAVTCGIARADALVRISASWGLMFGHAIHEADFGWASTLGTACGVGARGMRKDPVVTSRHTAISLLTAASVKYV